MAIPADTASGTLVRHKTLGLARVQPYLNFDGTKSREEMLKQVGHIYVKLENPPEGWVDVVGVDIEALELVVE